MKKIITNYTEMGNTFDHKTLYSLIDEIYLKNKRPDFGDDMFNDVNYAKNYIRRYIEFILSEIRRGNLVFNYDKYFKKHFKPDKRFYSKKEDHFVEIQKVLEKLGDNKKHCLQELMSSAFNFTQEGHDYLLSFLNCNFLGWEIYFQTNDYELYLLVNNEIKKLLH